MKRTDLADPRSAAVVAALRRSCELCRAAPGEPCRNLAPAGGPLARRPASALRQAHTVTAAARGAAPGVLAGRGVLVCYRETSSGTIWAEWTIWDTPEQARQAETELTPCCPCCIGVHTVVSVDLEPPRPRGRHLARFLP